MSKLTKLIRHPRLFFRDARIKKELKQLEMAGKFKSKKSGDGPQNKTIVKTVWNNITASNVSLRHIEVALYFSGDTKDIYQIESWLKIFSELEKSKYFLIVVRSKGAYAWIQKNTDFSVIHCVTIADLLSLYDKNNIKCILYVNHAFKNFQSLINGQALHIHINHGESDKTSTITRQSQAYDYVFVYGDASIDKYKLNLIRNDERRFVKIGRPQIEFTPEMETINTDKKIVLYAPTWEGTHDTMDFSSLRLLGLSIVSQLINSDQFYIVYKPHPKVGVRDPNVMTIHKEIIILLKKYEDALVMLDGDIVSLYEQTDIAIFDNSVVLIDYLPYDKPLLFNHIEKEESQMMSKSILMDTGVNITSRNIYQLIDKINQELEEDTYEKSRGDIKSYYLGEFDYFNSESTTKFVSEIDRLCVLRDEELEALKKLNEEDMSAPVRGEG